MRSRRGWTGSDVDGQLTRDSELVIFHDLSVDRLTVGTGTGGEKDAEGDAGAGPGPQVQARRQWRLVRTFEDFVRTVKGRGILMVELKVPGTERPPESSSGRSRSSGSTAPSSDVVLSSFNPLVLYRVKRIDPLVRTALIFMDTNWNPELVAEIKPDDLVNLPWPLRQELIRRAIRKFVRSDMLSINHQVDEAVIDRLIAKGWPAFLWTPDTKRDIRRALAKRPYGVISDQPILARAASRRVTELPASRSTIPTSSLPISAWHSWEPDLGWRLWNAPGRRTLLRTGAVLMGGLASAALLGCGFPRILPGRHGHSPRFSGLGSGLALHRGRRIGHARAEPAPPATANTIAASAGQSWRHTLWPSRPSCCWWHESFSSIVYFYTPALAPATDGGGAAGDPQPRRRLGSDRHRPDDVRRRGHAPAGHESRSIPSISTTTRCTTWCRGSRWSSSTSGGDGRPYRLMPPERVQHLLMRGQTGSYRLHGDGALLGDPRASSFPDRFPHPALLGGARLGSQGEASELAPLPSRSLAALSSCGAEISMRGLPTGEPASEALPIRPCRVRSSPAPIWLPSRWGRSRSRPPAPAAARAGQRAKAPARRDRPADRPRDPSDSAPGDSRPEQTRAASPDVPPVEFRNEHTISTRSRLPLDRKLAGLRAQEWAGQ